MHRFRIDKTPVIGESVQLSEAETKHMAKVLRMQTGDRAELLDENGGRFYGSVEELDGERARVKVEERLDDNEPGIRLTLYQGLPKAEKMEWIVQKATELGATCVQAVRMSRSVVKLDDKDARKKAERWYKIAQEATKQCGRAKTPAVPEAMHWKQALTAMKQHDVMIVPWEEAGGVTLKDICEKYPQAQSIGVLIGPEGGISQSEMDEMAENSSALPVTLGRRILRAETAAIATTALVMHLWGDI